MADSTSPTSPRRGFNVALMLSIIGIGLGGVALYLELTSDPFEPRFSGANPFRGSLDKYHMNTPAAAARAEIEIKLNRDFRAKNEYEILFEEKQLQEKFDTFKVDREEPFKREPDKDPKAKKHKGTGEFKILFVSYKEDKEDTKEIVVMEKYLVTDKQKEFWKRAFGVSSADVGKTNKELAADMDKWK